MLSKKELSIFENAGLLYSSTQNLTGYEYTDIATGDLDFERLVNEEVKCWRLPVSGQELKRKKIIITDLSTRFKIYTYNFVNEYEDRHVPEFELWVALLDHGFELFAWTGQLVQMKNIEDLLEYLFIIEPIKTNILIEKLSKLGINKDECFFVKTETRASLQELVFINHDILHEPSYKTIPNGLLVLMSLPYDLLEAYLDSLDPTIPFTLECNLKTILTYDCIHFLKKIAHLNLEIQVSKFVKTDQADYEQLLNLESNYLPELNQYIKNYRIAGLNIPEKLLLDLFSLGCIESLELARGTVTNSDVRFNQRVTDFNQLKKLTFSKTELHDFHFCMLNNSPDLEQLSIHHCDWNYSDFPLKDNALKSLKSFSYEETTFNDIIFLINLINATERLETLQIDDLGIPDNDLATLGRSKLQHLTELNITGNLYVSDIAFIRLCTNLESLTIYSLYDPEGVFFGLLNQCNLPRLRKISLEQNNLSGKIKHDWSRFNIDNFEKKIQTLSQLNRDAQKTNFLIPLDQDNLDNNDVMDSQKKELFDGETGSNDDVLSATEYFRPKKGHSKIGQYRLNTCRLGGLGEHFCFEPIPVGDFQTIDIPQKDNVEAIYDAEYEETEDVFLGTLELFPKDQQKWIKLPSFTPGDEILMVSSIENGNIELRNHDNHFYYVKINTNHTAPVAFHFLLKTTELNWQYSDACLSLQHTSMLDNYFNILKHVQFTINGRLFLPKQFHPDFRNLRSLPFEQIAYVLSEFCRGFTVEDLLPSDKTSPWQQLNRVIRERKGSCRHRARTFIALAYILGIEAELILNDCHEFVLIWSPDGSGRIQDLGGAESELQIANVSKTIQKRIEKQVVNTQTIDPDNPYICWQWQESTARTWKTWCAELLENSQKNILLSLDSTRIEDCLANLQVLQKTRNRQYIYIDNLDNIKTTQTVIGNNGEKHRQDSVLISSIKHARPGDILVVNWFEMKAEHIVYNTMMNTQKRMLKGTDFPEGLITISLQPNSRSIAEDFHSRFQLRSKCPLHLQSDLPLQLVIDTLSDAQQELRCINMYFPEEYRQLMTTKLACKDSRITVIESLLITALKQGEPGIVIRNAPRNDIEFRTFLGELLYSRRFHANGDVFEIPDDFDFILWDKPYELRKEHFSEHEFESGAEPADLKVLNNLTFKSFFNIFPCSNGQFTTSPGWIAQYANRELPVVLTNGHLSQTHWALLLEEAHLYDVTIKVIWIKQEPDELAMAVERVIACATFQASDLDLAEQLYFNDPSVFTVIPVSEETRYNDLIERFEKKNGYYEHHSCCVTNALLEGKQVFLKGELSPLLQKQLLSLLLPAPYLLINGQHIPFKPGQFRLLSIKAVTGNFFQCQRLQLPEPWVILSKQFELPLIEQAQQLCKAMAEQLPQEPAFSYIQLHTILQRLVQKPDSNPLKSILRLKSNYQELKPILEQLWDEYDPVGKYMSFKPGDIMTHRIQKVCNELKFSPYVFVAGSSGSGKSTLFLRKWERYLPDAKIYSGLNNIKAWFYCSNTHPCLVVDEANLLSRDAFAFLELLFQNQILIEGMIRPISPRHKIIFIGNFGHFKDRSQQAFFNHHGHIITFKELPDSFLRNNVLLPILSTRSDLIHENQADILLQAYQKIRQAVGASVSIRNLEMLAWRFLENLQYSQKHNESLCLALYDEFQIFFSDSNRPGFKKELEIYKLIKAELKNLLVFNVNDFVLTPTRKNPLRLINQFLHIRELKLNTEIYFTGIQGLILEGDSAEGKSSLLQHYLDSNDFVLATEDNINYSKRYCIIDDLESLEPILFKAFHEGALVIINEMNTMPVELLLNHYMSGVDKDNQPATKMGFAVFATQNPISFDFRKPLSPALLNRFQMITIKEYKPEEIKVIANTLCNKAEDAQKEANQYVAARTYAKNHGFLKPNIRTLINNTGKKRKCEEDIDDRANKKACFEK